MIVFLFVTVHLSKLVNMLFLLKLIFVCFDEGATIPWPYFDTIIRLNCIADASTPLQSTALKTF